MEIALKRPYTITNYHHINSTLEHHIITTSHAVGFSSITNLLTHQAAAVITTSAPTPYMYLYTRLFYYFHSSTLPPAPPPSLPPPLLTRSHLLPPSLIHCAVIITYHPPSHIHLTISSTSLPSPPTIPFLTLLLFACMMVSVGRTRAG